LGSQRVQTAQRRGQQRRHLGSIVDNRGLVAVQRLPQPDFGRLRRWLGRRLFLANRRQICQPHVDQRRISLHQIHLPRSDGLAGCSLQQRRSHIRARCVIRRIGHGNGDTAIVLGNG